VDDPRLDYYTFDFTREDALIVLASLRATGNPPREKFLRFDERSRRMALRRITGERYGVIYFVQVTCIFSAKVLY